MPTIGIRNGNGRKVNVDSRDQIALYIVRKMNTLQIVMLEAAQKNIIQ